MLAVRWQSSCGGWVVWEWPAPSNSTTARSDSPHQAAAVHRGTSLSDFASAAVNVLPCGWTAANTVPLRSYPVNIVVVHLATRRASLSNKRTKSSWNASISHEACLIV